MAKRDRSLSGPDLALQEPQKRRKVETTHIKVSGIANTISKSWLESTFKCYGKVHSIEVNEGKKENTACIHFSTREAAQSAAREMNGESVAGRVLSVELLQSQPDSSVTSAPKSPTHCRGGKVATSTTDQQQLFSIKLTNVPQATLEATLYEKCRVLKGFTSLKLVQVKDGSTNYAWVNFVNNCATAAQKALDGMTVEGNRIKAGQPRPCSRAYVTEQEPKSAMVSKPVPSKEFSFKLSADMESPSTLADSSTIDLKNLPGPSNVDPAKPLSLSPKRTSSLFQPVRCGLALSSAMLSALPQELQLSSKSSQGESTGGDQTKAAEPQKVASHSAERELAKVAGTESVAQAQGMIPTRPPKGSVESQKTPPPGARVGKAMAGLESTCTVQSTKPNARRAEHGSRYPPKQEQVLAEPRRTPPPALRHSQTQPLTLSEAATLVSTKSTGGGQSPSRRVVRGSRTPSPTTVQAETLDDNQPKGDGVNGSRSGSPNPFKRALARRPSPVQHLTKSSSFPRACVKEPVADVAETVKFLDPLAKRIFISECESELNAIQKKYLVTIRGEEVDGTALTLSCGNRVHLMTAKTEITAQLQRVQASISVHSFPISCRFLPCLADPDTLSLLQGIERQDSVEFSIVASTRQMKLPECSQELKSKLLECKTPLRLSGVPDYTEIRLGYFWKVINASTKQIKGFESDINDRINTAYIQRESMCSFEYKGHSYTVDFSLMTVTDKTSGGQAHDIVKDPVWCRYMDEEFGYEHMTEDISAIIERAFQQGVPGFVEIQNQQCVFDFSSDPMRAYSKGMKEQSSVFVQRDPSPTSSEHVVTVRVRGIASNLSAAEERFRTTLSSRVTTKTIDIPPKVNERVTQLLLLGMARQYCIQCTLSQDRRTLELTGSKEIVTDVKEDLAQEIIKILSESNAPSQCVFPSHWDHQTENVALCRVAESSPEWVHIDKLMKESLTSVKIQTIERIQNKHLWQKYDFFRKTIEERTQGSGVNEKELFHGTRSNHPSAIYESEKGFDFRFGSENSLWGQGTYFAVKASYSDRSYSYRPSGGQKQLILAKVVTGESIFMKQTEKLKVPPLKPGGKVERYDTVRANTGGTEIYVVYDHEKAYPAYLISYRN